VRLFRATNFQFFGSNLRIFLHERTGLGGGQMSNYNKEKWMELYHSALLELEHAKMAGRIGDARFEIAARIEKLCGLPGLHIEEREALSDALTSLRTLEREDAQHAKNERAIAESAHARLRVLGPRMESL